MKGPAVGFQSEPDKSERPEMVEILSSSSSLSSESELSEFDSGPSSRLFPSCNMSEDKFKSTFSFKVNRPFELKELFLKFNFTS